MRASASSRGGGDQQERDPPLRARLRQLGRLAQRLDEGAREPSAAAWRSKSVSRMVILSSGWMIDHESEIGNGPAGLLDAALAEFSEKGLAGARVSAIAARAGVNKQLISYYFAGKRGLYDALVQQWLEAEAEFARPDLTLGELSARTSAARSRTGRCPVSPARVARGPARRAVGSASRRSRSCAAARGGRLPRDLDPAFVLLALQGAAAAGLIFPGDARRVRASTPAPGVRRALRRAARAAHRPPRLAR